MTTMQKIIKYCAIAFALFLIITIISGIAGAAASFSFIFGKEKTPGKMKTYEVEDTVQSLEIDLNHAQLEIKTGDRFLIESNNKYLKSETSDGLLKIKEERPSFGYHSKDIRLILTVPEKFSFDSASISTGAGTVKIDALLSQKLSLDLGAGEADINTLYAASRAKINGGAGELKIKGGELHDLDFDMGVGEVDLESRLSGDCDIDYGVGELNMTLSGTEKDYCIELDKGLGNATLNGREMHDGETYGSGDTFIKIDGGIGELSICFSLL